MAADRDGQANPPTNRLDEAVSVFREMYVESHGEEPSEELLEAARRQFVRAFAKKDRDEHREIYDALADE
jgi:hypothetical protein